MHPSLTTMATDPNWLPSTLAQATAALVAIMGGLIVTQLIGLSIEAASLRQRRDELEAAAKVLRDQAEEHRDELLKRHLHHLIIAARDDMVEARGDLDISERLPDWLPSNFIAGERGIRNLKKPDGWLEDTRANIVRMFELIENEYPESTTVSIDQRELVERIPELGEFAPSLVESVATEIQYRRDRQDEDGFAIPPTYGFIPNWLSREVDFHERELKALTYAEKANRGAQDVLQDQLEHIQAPKGVGLGMFTLAAFATFGIVFPMIVMAIDPVPSSSPIRIALISAFAAGFAALLTYLTWFLRELRRQNPAETIISQEEARTIPPQESDLNLRLSGTIFDGDLTDQGPSDEASLLLDDDYVDGQTEPVK